MTVYVKIKNAFIPSNIQPKTTLLKIQAEDSQLFTRGAIINNHLEWNVSLISSITQNKLNFQLIDQSITSNQVLKSDLYFSTFRCLPDKQISESIIFTNGIKLNLQIFYTQNPRYLGQLEFYNAQQNQQQDDFLIEQDVIIPKIQTINGMVESRVVQYQKTAQSSPQKVHSDYKKPKVNFFYCCADNTDDKAFQVEEYEDYGAKRNSYEESPFKNQIKARPRQKIFKENPNFYKGPCQNKNLFSACDGSTKDQQFQIVQDHYKLT